MRRPFLSNLCKPFVLLTIVAALLCGFKAAPDVAELLGWSNHCLNRYYDQSAESKLKKLELTLTDDYFFRLRKTYQTGKQEYFSMKMHSFDDLDYSGSPTAGTLIIKTKADDIIVQTYNDRLGNVDSMATQLNIPVKDMDVEEVDSLRSALISLKQAAEAR
ncbi:hypothetical protein C8P68_11078 [Mucilaginibacter yixingensis]|uniref:Uncharacterized protein n=1 Tax=Mucilaginibacter yixingensis TaxID=1295612 RepID=A0A2T5J541_9SPHI|nr:hypothetical protein [Mucilaginibacter yixingensis]PTQ92947.1 hypothetical protein C8P68_11078 [Mucilaginibacter yixingensis]